jgi:DNA-binding transcriptional ArsR family regulator
VKFLNITVDLEELESWEKMTPENKARFLELKTEEEKEKEVGQQKKNSPFAHWLQVNNSDDAYKAESWLMRKSPIGYMILRFLAKEMDNYNAIICSFKVMEEALGYSRAALSKAISILKEHHYIDVKKSGTSNVYLINKELYWKSWGTNYKYAEFGTKIIISESEQETEGKEKIKSTVKSTKMTSLNIEKVKRKN